MEQEKDFGDDETFEDAPEEVQIEKSMNLLQSIEDAQISLHLFLNNHFETAKDRLRPYIRTSMYHAIGYATIHYLQAMMTWEQKDIDVANELLKAACDLCSKYRKPSKLIKSRNNFTDEQLHAELCFAECLLQRALLTFVQDENLVSFIRGALKVRTCFQSYKECQRLLHEHVFDEKGEKSKAHFESGVRMGVGAFNLLIAQLPPRVLRLLEFVGFQGNKHFGFTQLWTAAGMRQALRSPLCSLILLGYLTIAVYVFGMGDSDISQCEQLITPLKLSYPKGCLVLFFAGRLSEIKGDIEGAVENFNYAINSQSEWTQIHHICYWELIFCYAYARNWVQAAEFAWRLYLENKWSPLVYSYFYSVFTLARGAKNLSDEESTRIRHLLKQTPTLKQRIAGKSIPVEKFCSVMADRYFRCGERLCLPYYELLYLNNGFHVLAQRDDLLQPIFDEISEASARVKNGSFDANDYCLSLLLKAMCFKYLQSPFQAQQCLKEISKYENDLSDHYYVLPNAMLELAILQFEEKNDELGKASLMRAKECKGYLLESRLHFRFKAVEEKFLSANNQ